MPERIAPNVSDAAGAFRHGLRRGRSRFPADRPAWFPAVGGKGLIRPTA